MSQYGIACKCFSETILEKTDQLEPKSLVTEEDMKNYFSNFVKDLTNETSDLTKPKDQLTNK